MNYQHEYHAGHFADVFKHLVWMALIESLQRKDKPLCVIDTHAGAGAYDLSSAAAQATEEYKLGIARVKESALPDKPAIVDRYLTFIQKECEKRSLHFYPGSPFIAATYLRAQDRFICNELHPKAAQDLRHLLKHDPRCHIHQRDAYEFLPAILPPKEQRALILIDPPFEKPTEFNDLITALQRAHQKFPQGVYAIWYPIKKQGVESFYKSLTTLEIKTKLILELQVSDPKQTIHTMLVANGMVILNPPYQIEEALNPLLNWLCKVLALDSQAKIMLK